MPHLMHILARDMGFSKQMRVIKIDFNETFIGACAFDIHIPNIF